jgi:hypothetical protein
MSIIGSTNINTSIGSLAIGACSTSHTCVGNTNIITTGTNNTIFSGYNATISAPKSKFNILGEEFEISTSYDVTVGLMISSLNVLGYKYYDELIKNNISFHGELKDVIERKVNEQRRDDKINNILK